MDEIIKNREPGFCEVSLRKIDAALSSPAGAMLSLDQFDEVTRLRRRIRLCCENGREEEARDAVKAAMAILTPHIAHRL
jgi:hypothetical protein